METSNDTLQVGKKLVEFCKHGDNIKAIDELYSPEIESQEPMAMPGMPERMQGIEAIRTKNKEWNNTMEVHSTQVEGPFPLGERFAVHFKYDATEKKTNKRMTIEEVGLYTVRDGKIAKEEFFYTM
jgi:ketosteroid isomerase-like protein